MCLASLISTIGVSNVRPFFNQTFRVHMLQYSSWLTSRSQSACKAALKKTGHESVPGNGDTLCSHIRQLQHSFIRTALWPQHRNLAFLATATASAHSRAMHQSSRLPPLSGQFLSAPRITILDVCTLRTSNVSRIGDEKHSMRPRTVYSFLGVQSLAPPLEK